MAPKEGKLTEHDQNLIDSEGSQDTSAFHNSHHSSMRSQENAWKTSNLTSLIKLDQLYQIKMAPKGGKSTDPDQNLISLDLVRIHRHAKIQTIPPMHS